MKIVLILINLCYSMNTKLLNWMRILVIKYWIVVVRTILLKVNNIFYIMIGLMVFH